MVPSTCMYVMMPCLMLQQLEVGPLSERRAAMSIVNLAPCHTITIMKPVHLLTNGTFYMQFVKRVTYRRRSRAFGHDWSTLTQQRMYISRSFYDLYSLHVQSALAIKPIRLSRASRQNRSRSSVAASLQESVTCSLFCVQIFLPESPRHSRTRSPQAQRTQL